jgi:hypothetical protein
MILKTKRRLLWTASAAAALAGLLSVTALVAVPVTGPGDGAAVVIPPDPPPPPAKKAPLSAYEAISRKNFLQPLFDAPVAGVEALKPNIKLLGTIIEKDQSLAMLQAKNGQVLWAQVGEAVDGAEVVTIAADAVTVRVSGQTFILKAENAGAAP